MKKPIRINQEKGGVQLWEADLNLAKRVEGTENFIKVMWHTDQDAKSVREMAPLISRSNENELNKTYGTQITLKENYKKIRLVCFLLISFYILESGDHPQ